MATLHFICGKAGAGKTTLARRLGRELPAVVLCEDEWLCQLASPIVTVTEFIAASRRLRAAMRPHLIELLRLGNHVVLDFGIANTRAGRAWIREVFESAGADHVLHYLPTDDATCLSRVHQRNEAKPEGVFFGVASDAQVEEIGKYFAAPQDDEAFRIQLHP